MSCLATLSRWSAWCALLPLLSIRICSTLIKSQQESSSYISWSKICSWMQCCVSDWNFICSVEMPTFDLVNSTIPESILCTRKQQYSTMLSLFSTEKHSAVALSVTHLPVTDWHLVLRPPVSRNGLKTGFVNFCTLKNQHKRNSVMIQWQRLVCHRLATFTNYITFLGWIFISET